MQTEAASKSDKQIRVSGDLHQQLKIYCANNGADMKRTVDGLIAQLLTTQKGATQ